VSPTPAFISSPQPALQHLFCWDLEELEFPALGSGCPSGLNTQKRKLVRHLNFENVELSRTVEKHRLKELATH